jgi:AraC-like DNA-binding protein
MDSIAKLPLPTRIGRRPVSAGVIRVGPLMSIPRLLEAAGVDPEPVLVGYGLDVAYFADPENIVTFDTGGRLLAQSVERTDLPHFGLLVGQDVRLSSLGTVGYLMSSAPDVGAALQGLAKYLHIHDGGAVVTLDVQSGFASLGYTVLTPGIVGYDIICDVAMAASLRIVRELCGGQWRPAGVSLSRALPADTGPWRSLFGSVPSFDAETTAIHFPAELLARPLASADPVLHRLMTERAAEAVIGLGEDIVARLKRALRPLIGYRECKVDLIAERLGMPTRTLNRRLEAMGTTFRDLRDETRLEAAQQQLRQTPKPADEVAETLGFSDASAFTRAFRRRFGMAPATWRRNARRTG